MCQFSPFTLWGLGVKLRSSGSAASASTCGTILLTHLFFLKLYMRVSEIANYVKCLPHKLEELSSDS